MAAEMSKAEEARNSQRADVDLVFLIDVTGSMQPCIDSLPANIEWILTQMEIVSVRDLRRIRGVSSSDQLDWEWRARVCAYRDWAEDDEPWIEHPFVRDKASLDAQLESLVADGGGDEPESLLDAIYKSVMCGETERGEPSDDLKWRHRNEAHRYLIIFTDATYHPEMLVDEAKGGNLDDVSVLVGSHRVKISLFAPDFPCYEELLMIDMSEWEPIPFDADDRQGAVKAFSDVMSNTDKFKEHHGKIFHSVFSHVGDDEYWYFKQLPPFTDAVLAHFKGLENRLTLDLSCTEITDAGLVDLKRLAKLQLLSLRHTKVTDAGVADLQKALPNCKISK